MTTDDWRLYEDPDGYFSLRMPDEWTVERSTMLGRTSWHDEFLFEIPRISMVCGPAPDAFGRPFVSVRFTVLHDRPTLFRLAAPHRYPGAPEGLSKQYFLPQAPTPNTMLGDLSAYNDGQTWEVDLPEAHIFIAYRPARRGGYRAFGADDTREEEQQLTAFERFAPLATAVIASFRPGLHSGWHGEA